MLSHDNRESPILIVGYGNSLRRDDGLGPEAITRLKQRVCSQCVRTMTLHQLGPEVAEAMSLARLVIFIDAAKDLPPGTVIARNIQHKPQTAKPTTHQFSPEQLLDSCIRWYAATPKVVVCSVGGHSFGVGEGLSSQVELAMSELMRRIQQVLASFVAVEMSSTDPMPAIYSHA